MNQLPTVVPQFESAVRQHKSLLATREKQVLIALAQRLPDWMNSDHLTAIGLLGMFLAGLSYFYAKWNPLSLIAAVVFLAVNWFGDSLDGTLARVRNRQRPRYGFYVDHIFDAFGTLALIGGLGLSGYMSGTVALALIVAYFLLVIEISLATYSIGIFRLSFGVFGPTELRILLALGTLILLKKPLVSIADRTYLLCDVGGVVAVTVLIGLTILSTIRNTMHLYRNEPLI